MATPYEFIAHQLKSKFTAATIEPFTEENEWPHPRWTERVYQSGSGDGFAPDYTKLSVSYPGGYPCYYPLQVTLPNQRPLVLQVARGADFRAAFTRADSEARSLLACYGYWRIEAAVDPATTDFWILMLRPQHPSPQYLILPTTKLQQLLNRTHNPEKFSLFLGKNGLAFAAQPLHTAERLNLLREPVLMATDEFRDLDMHSYLNNWDLWSTPQTSHASSTG